VNGVGAVAINETMFAITDIEIIPIEQITFGISGSWKQLGAND
jgi:hypothetical protein